MNVEIVLYDTKQVGNQRGLLASPLLLVALVSYLLIAGAVVIYLNMPARFVSQFSLVLPGSGSSSRVMLHNVGQVSQSSTSAFGNNIFSPLSNYKQIIQSLAVRQRAADSLDLTLAKFGSAKIQIFQQTSIMGIKARAASASAANKKAWVLYESFQEELNRLRLDESSSHDASMERILNKHRERLNRTHKSIVDFQQRSLLVSTTQVGKKIEMLAKINDRLTFSESKHASQKKYVRRLSEHLGVSPALAGHALSLQSDAEFGGYLTELDQVATQLSRYDSQWGKSHPKVVAEKQRYNSVLEKLALRSTNLVGVHSAKILHGMNLNTADELAGLFSALLDSGAKLQGMAAEIEQLRLAEIRIDDQLRVYTRESAELKRMQREHQRAEAIYNAAAGRLEAGEIDVFGSYPVVQMLAAPSVAEDQIATRRRIAIVVGLLGIFTVTLALVVIWQRDRLVKVLLKKN